MDGSTKKKVVVLLKLDEAAARLMLVGFGPNIINFIPFTKNLNNNNKIAY
jgi:hypothetical protein